MRFLFIKFLEYKIYTDGSSKAGLGSWAYIITRKDKMIAERSGCIRHANSNTMEFHAAIEALRSIPKNSNLILFSDSRILIDAMQSGEGPPTFQDEIEILRLLNQRHTIKWQWVKAHSGNKFNERCDQLCILARS